MWDQSNQHQILVDDDLLEHLSLHKWYISKKSGYAKNSKLGLMHRYVMCRVTQQTLDRHMLVDHINGNRLDNRSTNLRIANHKANATNRSNDPKLGQFIGVVPIGSSEPRYKVVSMGSEKPRYKVVYKGIVCFESHDMQLCALCYDTIARYCRGKWARVNFPDASHSAPATTIGTIPIAQTRPEFPLNLMLTPEVLSQLDQIRAKFTSYVGVHRSGNKWKSVIKIDLGSFDRDDRAAAEYDLAVLVFKLDKPLNHPRNFYTSADVAKFKQRHLVE
jgi:hypothetical protein